jgi:hypothetical protein
MLNYNYYKIQIHVNAINYRGVRGTAIKISEASQTNTLCT